MTDEVSKPKSTLKTCFECGNQGHFAHMCLHNVHYVCTDHCEKFLTPNDYEECLGCQGIHGFGFLATCAEDMERQTPKLDLREDEIMSGKDKGDQ